LLGRIGEQLDIEDELDDFWLAHDAWPIATLDVGYRGSCV
jgi:hypothetical protein